MQWEHVTDSYMGVNIAVVKACEPPHDKSNKVIVRPGKTQTSLGIRPIWSEFAVRSVGS